MSLEQRSDPSAEFWRPVGYGPESFAIGDVWGKPTSYEAGLERRLGWSENIDESFKKALAQNKPLVILFTNDKCGWCKALDKELQDPGLAKYQGDAVYLKLKVQDNVDDDAKRLYNLMKVEGYPTMSIVRLSRQGGLRELMRNSGYIESKTIADKFNSAFSSTIV